MHSSWEMEGGGEERKEGEGRWEGNVRSQRRPKQCLAQRRMRMAPCSIQTSAQCLRNTAPGSPNATVYCLHGVGLTLHM